MSSTSLFRCERTTEMAKFNDSLTGLIKEVEKFLAETLKNENLSTNASKQRTQLLEKVINIKQEYPQLQSTDTPPQPGNSPKSLHKSNSIPGISDESKERDESFFTGGSGNADDEEGAYSESIPFIAATDIVNITKSGFLEKKRKKDTVLLKSYQKRYCVLKDNILYYYEKPTDKRQLGAFVLKDYEVRTSPNLSKEPSKKDLNFDLLCPGKRTYQFIASSKEDLLEWKSAIEKAAINTITSSMIDPEGESIYEEFDDLVVRELSKANADIYDNNLNEVYDDAETVPIKKFEKPPVTSSPKKSATSLPPVPPPRKEDPLPALPDRNPPTLRGKSDQSGSTSSPAKSTTSSVVENELMDELYDDVGTDAQQFLRNSKKIDIQTDEYENIYCGQWDCKADDNSELTFKKGDLIRILSKEFDTRSWWIGLLNGQVGLVPKTFLTQAYEIVA